MSKTKPLGHKAYGSIGHLPNSRLGPGDHKVSDDMARICCERVRDKHDFVVVQEKLDGSCVAVALIDGVLHPLGRAGYPAISSPYEQHRMFDQWVSLNAERFFAVLQEGERIVGEWLAQAHGTKYDLKGREPFVAFDIMRGTERMAFEGFLERVVTSFSTPGTFPSRSPLPIEDAMAWLGDHGFYGAIDKPEGVVYRVERKGKVDFLAKYVRTDKVDGCYLPEVSGNDPIWNWEIWRRANPSNPSDPASPAT